MIDELRLKNALRCQYGQGKKYCDYCPYKKDNGDCDNGKICKDANAYIMVVELVSSLLQNEIKQLFEEIG